VVSLVCCAVVAAAEIDAGSLHDALPIWRRGEQLVLDVADVVDLVGGTGPQAATTLLSTIEDLKPADVADVLHDLPADRQIEVAEIGKHTSELQSRENLVCRLLREKKKSE